MRDGKQEVSIYAAVLQIHLSRVYLVEGVSDDLNVQLVQILLGDAVQEKRRCASEYSGNTNTKRSVHKHRVVQLSGGGGDGQTPKLREDAKRVAFGDELERFSARSSHMLTSWISRS